MKNILNFNIEATKEKLTPRSGVIIFGECLKGLELEALINKSLPSTNHHSVYNSSEFFLLPSSRDCEITHKNCKL